MATPLLTENQVVARIERGDYPQYHGVSQYVIFDDGCRAKASVMRRLAIRGKVAFPSSDNATLKFTAPTKEATAS